MSNVRLDCSAGSITGRRGSDGIIRFLGIPYALPPVGDLRFQAPKARPAGDVEAFDFGPTPPACMMLPAPYAYPVIQGDDWLTLNVWTPDTNPASPLPVFVWIYGGSFAMGSSAQSLYDGTAFARDGVVFVSLNYRVGVEGFLHIDGVPDNRGLLDQVCALKWVRDNISSFGGDPARVTVGGESAGSMSVSALATTRYAGELFQQAICESGIASGLTVDAASVAADWISRSIELQTSLERLKACDPRELASQVAAKLHATTPNNFFTMFLPVIDGDLVVQNPVDTLLEAPAPVKFIIGTNADEADFWRVFGELRVPEAISRLPQEGLEEYGSRVDSIFDLYCGVLGDATSEEVLSQVASDAIFGGGAYAAQVGQGGNCYAYYFTWPTPLHTRSALHTLELGFVFDNTQDQGHCLFAGNGSPAELAKEMHSNWVSFITSGAPLEGWNTFDGKEQNVRTFGPERTRIPRLLASWHPASSVRRIASTDTVRDSPTEIGPSNPGPTRK